MKNNPIFPIRYKICEVRPPSIEKFLDTDGFSLDASAPAVTMPANEIASPFDSRNTMFGRDVFWSLVPLPMKSRYYYCRIIWWFSKTDTNLKF